MWTAEYEEQVLKNCTVRFSFGEHSKRITAHRSEPKRCWNAVAVNRGRFTVSDWTWILVQSTAQCLFASCACVLNFWHMIAGKLKGSIAASWCARQEHQEEEDFEGTKTPYTENTLQIQILLSFTLPLCTRTTVQQLKAAILRPARLQHYPELGQLQVEKFLELEKEKETTYHMAHRTVIARKSYGKLFRGGGGGGEPFTLK